VTLPLAGQPELAHLAAGDLLASGHGQGFLRRIQSVTQPGDGTVVFTTAPAALADAVVSGRGALQIVDGVAPAAGSATRDLTAQTVAIQVSLKDKAIYDDGTVRLAVDQLDYTFTPSIDVGFSFANHAVEEFHQTVSGTSSFSATASLSATGAVERQA